MTPVLSRQQLNLLLTVDAPRQVLLQNMHARSPPASGLSLLRVRDLLAASEDTTRLAELRSAVRSTALLGNDVIDLANEESLDEEKEELFEREDGDNETTYMREEILKIASNDMVARDVVSALNSRMEDAGQDFQLHLIEPRSRQHTAEGVKGVNAVKAMINATRRTRDELSQCYTDEWTVVNVPVDYEETVKREHRRKHGGEMSRAEYSKEHHSHIGRFFTVWVSSARNRAMALSYILFHVSYDSQNKRAVLTIGYMCSRDAARGLGLSVLLVECALLFAIATGLPYVVAQTTVESHVTDGVMLERPSASLLRQKFGFSDGPIPGYDDVLIGPYTQYWAFDSAGEQKSRDVLQQIKDGKLPRNAPRSRGRDNK
jgi:GNAT superfamily N-acetyltransferase